MLKNEGVDIYENVDTNSTEEKETAVDEKKSEANIENSKTIPLTNETDSGKIESEENVENVEENNVVSETEIEEENQQENVQPQETEVETAQKYGFDNNFTLNKDGNIVLSQNNIDYNNQTMRSGKFKVVGPNKTTEEVNGYVYGKYGIRKYKGKFEGKDVYGVTHLPSGFNSATFNSLNEAKQFIIALDEVTEYVPITYQKETTGVSTLQNEYMSQLSKTIKDLKEKGDYKKINTYPHKIKDGKVPFKTRAELIEYMKNRVGDKVRVKYPKNGSEDVRTITSANNGSYKTTKADGDVVAGFFPESGKIKITDTGFLALDEMGNTRYELDFVNVEDVQPVSQQETRETPTEAKETVREVTENGTETNTEVTADHEKKEVNENSTGTTDIDLYTENMSAMQKANVKKALNKSFNTKEYGALSYAEFINKSIQDGKTLEIQKSLKNTIENAKSNFEFSKDTSHSFESNKAKYHSRGMNRADFVKEARDLSQNKTGGENIKAVDPKLYYCITGDETALPDNCFNTTYCVNTDENGYYSVPKTVYDYGVWVKENKTGEAKSTEATAETVKAKQTPTETKEKTETVPKAETQSKKAQTNETEKTESPVKEIDVDNLLRAVEKANVGDTVKLADYEKKEVKENGTDETTTLNKNDKGHSEVQAQSEGMDDRVHRVSAGRHETVGIDGGKSSSIEERTGKNEERKLNQSDKNKSETKAIEDVVESEKFREFKTFVGNEIDYTTLNDIQKEYENDSRLDEGYELSEVLAYDMLTDENNSLRETFSDNIEEYFNKDIDVTQDITGKKVATAILKSTKKSKVKNKNGQLIPLYHATDKNFDTFEIGDIGFHFGSKAQAIKRAKDKNIKNPNFIKGYLNIENPLYIDEDFFGWNASQIAQKLEKEGIITNEESVSLIKKEGQKGNAELQELLKEKGYDGIVYKNDKEALNGNSYIVFDDKQILRGDNETAQEFKQPEIGDVVKKADWFSFELPSYSMQPYSLTIIGESESGKAWKVRFETETIDGERDLSFEKYIPKKAVVTNEMQEYYDERREKSIADGKEKYNAMIEFAKSHGIKGVRVGLKKDTILKKIEEAGYTYDYENGENGIEIVYDTENKKENKKGAKEDVHDRVLDTESGRHVDGAVSENLQTEEKRGNAQNVDSGNRAVSDEQLRENARATEDDTSSAGHLEHTEPDTGTNLNEQLRERGNSEGNDGGVHKVPDRKLNKNNYTVSNEIDNVKPNHEKNLEAIRLLKELEKSGKKATKEEKAILAGYKGWGGLKDSFFGYKNTQLKNLLTEEEYKNARASILNAHYTPTKVIDEMYKGIKRLGFNGGNILEPSMGVGNFFGRMPSAISSKSNLYGVELDSITGRIAKQLYPDADISIMPFQDVKYPDNTFDLIMTNVPFSEVRYAYKKGKYTLHDYFIVKSLDKLKENGIGMFITSSGTLDKLDMSVRNEISSKADIIACYRLPNNTFTKNANAQVTTDIIVLQKREQGNALKGEKIESIGNLNSIPINEYYVNHPENVLGELTYQSGPYGERVQVVSDGTDIATALNKAMKKLPKDLIGGNVDLKPISVEIGESEKSHFVYEDGKAYFINAETKERSKPYGDKRTPKIRDYIALKNAYNKFLDYHTSTYPYTESELKQAREELNDVYDNFFKNYGGLQDTLNKFLAGDSDYIRITGLEIYDTKTKSYKKSDIFTKDTISYKKPEKSDNSTDALAVSINETGGIDFKRMESLTGFSKEKIVNDLADKIIETPDGNYELIDVYLSGNIREKLKKAQNVKGFERNVELLKSVMPKDKTPSQIVPKLGAPWVDKVYIRDFIIDILDCYGKPTVNFDKTRCDWSVRDINASYHNMNEKYGTKRANAGKLIEATLNNKFASVYDKIDDKRVLNREETANARQKQLEIREAFSNWIFKDKDRRDALTKKYNELFNSHRNMDYSGLAKYITFPNLSDGFNLRNYQKEAVAMTVFGGNSLLAHGVGTGKTCEMIASAMELKRMGIVHKSMMIVPKAKVGDFRTDILKTYPNAKVLAATEKDFETEKRKKLFSQIATNDWDIVVIGHSSFEKIPLNPKTEAMQVEEEIDELESVIRSTREENSNMRKSDGRFLAGLTKSLEARRAKLKRLLDVPKDDTLTFEEMGIDSIFVDEAHNFKNLPFYTKLNVPGIKSSEAQKATDLKMKCDYIRSKNGRIVFATATPITNSVSEMYNMTRYVRPEIFEEAQIFSFDGWASNYGNIEVKVEMSPDGRNFRAKERFSKYDNVQEMVGMFRRYASVLKTSDVVKDLPKAKYVDVISPSTEIHEKYISDIVRRINNMSGGKDDNMLLVTDDGRAMATDLRLVMSQIEGYNAQQLDLPESRINKAVNNIVSEYKNSNETKGTQFVFLDYGMNADGKRYSFNLYDDIINKLVKNGIPEKEIAKIGDYKTSAKKDKLFAKMNNGEIRVLIGSTAKMGEGVNAQQKAVALHHLNAPYRPSDIEQREGRIIRFGNENKDVTIYRYIQEKSFDSYMWQMLARKAEFINQAMSNGEIDELEETSEFVLSAKEGMAIASGNPLIMKKIEVDEEVKKLRGFQKSYNSNVYFMEERIRKLPLEIQKTEFKLENINADVKVLENNKLDDFQITIDGKKYDNRNEAAKALIEKTTNFDMAFEVDKDITVGSYRGLKIVFKKELDVTQGFGSFKSRNTMFLQGVEKHPIEYGDSMLGNITKLVNCADNILKEQEAFEIVLEKQKKELEQLKVDIKEPFKYQKELDEALNEQNRILTELQMDKVDSRDIEDDNEEDTSDNGVSYDLDDQENIKRWNTEKYAFSSEPETKKTKTENVNKTALSPNGLIYMISDTLGIPISKGNI